MRRLAWVVAAACLWAAGSALAGGKPVFRYLGAKWCKPCHSRNSPNPKLRVYHGWLESSHAKAWEHLPEDQRDNPRCLRCHTTGYGLPRRADTTDADLRGVQCEACHGPGSHYFPWRIMKDPERARKLGLRDPTREVCTQCHW